MLQKNPSVDFFRSPGKPGRVMAFRSVTACVTFSRSPRSDTNRPKLLDFTADYADHADEGNIRAISEIRGQYAWAILGESALEKT